MASRESSLARSQSLWLLACSSTTLAPLLPGLPPWLAAYAVAVLAWRGWLCWRERRLPPRWLVITLVLAGVAAVGFAYRSLLGREPGVALLVVFLALKQMELGSRRDAMTVVLLCYFLQLALFFDNQSPWIAGYMVGNLIVITAALRELHAPRTPVRASLRRAGVMLAQATPFMLILFVLFPRVQGPLWGMPRDAFSAKSGLSDTMSPGSISDLSLSGALAFRVKFDGEVPPPRKLYWRGPVLSRFDGRTWHIARAGASDRLPYEADGVPVSYVVTLEAHDRPWLLALDMPGRLPPQAVINRDYQVLARQPIRLRSQYAMVSHPDYVAGAEESADALRIARQLPPAANNPRSRELAQRWAEQAARPEDLIRRALEHFRREPFVYTLIPPLLGQNSVDEFLFETRRGFCEHYASAFVFLMRAAGVPARIVTGYQGGEINPIDGYLLVRQSDAHAWAEVWIEKRGWIRVDPTAAVAPSRIERGVASAMGEGEPLPLLARADVPWLNSLRFQWEALSNAWDQWVLGYSTDRQQQLLARLGMRSPDWQSLTAMMAALTGLLTLGLTAWALRGLRQADPVQRAWLRLGAKLARIGLGRRPGEGPLEYAERVGSQRPALREEIAEIATLYAKLRYGPTRDPVALEALRGRIRKLRPA